jgi:hypothetical protein
MDGTARAQSRSLMNRRAWIWATVRFTPQRVPILPQWTTNFRCTGESVMAAFPIHGRACEEADAPSVVSVYSE